MPSWLKVMLEVVSLGMLEFLNDEEAQKAHDEAHAKALAMRIARRTAEAERDKEFPPGSL